LRCYGGVRLGYGLSALLKATIEGTHKAIKRILFI
jgi:hypothetical protein